MNNRGKMEDGNYQVMSLPADAAAELKCGDIIQTSGGGMVIMEMRPGDWMAGIMAISEGRDPDGSVAVYCKPVEVEAEGAD